MSLFHRPKTIIGAQDRWTNFSESGAFLEIYFKLRGKYIEVLDGHVRKFARIQKICENTLTNLNIFAFTSALLSFLCFGKLKPHILYTEQWCANCQVNKTCCMSENAQKIDF